MTPLPREVICWFEVNSINRIGDPTRFETHEPFNGVGRCLEDDYLGALERSGLTTATKESGAQR